MKPEIRQYLIRTIELDKEIKKRTDLGKRVWLGTCYADQLDRCTGKYNQ